MKRKIKLLAVCLCMSVLAVSCGKRTDVGKEEPYIYCLNEDRTGLAKVSFDFPEGEAEEVAEAVLEELKKALGRDRVYCPHPRRGGSPGVRIEREYPGCGFQQRLS